MLQCHLCGVLDLEIGATKELAGSSSSHRTGYTNLSLTSDFCARDRSIGAYDISEEACGSQGSQNTLLWEVAARLEMIEYRGDDTTASTSRRRNNTSARCIMLADSESIGIDETSILDTGRAVALGLDLVESSLTA